MDQGYKMRLRSKAFNVRSCKSFLILNIKNCDQIVGLCGFNFKRPFNVLLIYSKNNNIFTAYIVKYNFIVGNVISQFQFKYLFLRECFHLESYLRIISIFQQLYYCALNSQLQTSRIFILITILNIHLNNIYIHRKINMSKENEQL